MFEIESVKWNFLWSAYEGYLDVIKYLVEHGADIHAEGDWALETSVWEGHLEVAKYLKEQLKNV